MRATRSILLVLAIVLPSTALAATFVDTFGSPYESAIEDLAHRGVVQGFRDGTYRPELRINRAEFLTILMNARAGTAREPMDLRCFKDLEVRTPQWYARAVCAAHDLGIVRGYPDGTFRPDQAVNLAEALKMSFLTFGILPSGSSGPWYAPYLELARSRNILVPLLKFPALPITRGEMASVAATLLAERETTASSCGNGRVEGREQCDDGNTRDSDGCSSICIIVPEPLRRSLLQIDEEANGVVTNIARGQLKVPLLRFSAVANRQDAVITALTFVPTVGTLLYGTHYTLSMDRNGDGLYEQTVQTNGRAERDRLVFDRFGGGGIVIPKDLRIPFLVTTDLVSTLGPVGLGIEFGTTIPNYIEAQGALDGLSLPGIETDGVCTAPDCFIRVNTREATTINVVSRGSLFVTEDSQPTRSHILLGGTTTDTLLRLQLRAEGEAIDLTKIAIDGVPGSVDSLLLYRVTSTSFDPHAAVPFAQASNGQCPTQPLTRACAVLPLSTLVIQPNTTVTIAVAARMKNDQGGAVSGQIASLSLSAATGDSHAIDARGISSQAELEQNNGDGVLNGEVIIGHGSPVANTQISARLSDVALAKISSVTRAGPAQQSFIPTGNATIGSFTIAASPHTNAYNGSNDVVLKTMTFHVTAQNVQLDPAGFRLSDADNPSLTLPCSGNATTGSFDVTCSMIDSGVIRSHIDEGTSATYRLTGNVTNPALGAGTSILSVDLATLGQRAATNSIQWSDEVTTFPWVDIPETSIMGTVYR